MPPASRRSLTTDTGCHHGEVAQTVNGHTECRCVRSNGFVESKGCSVTGTGQHGQQERTESTADLGNFVGVSQILNENFNDACGT